MRKPRAGRIDIAQRLIKQLVLVAPTDHGIEVVKALKAEEARTLRVCSTRLRREASKIRARDVDVVLQIIQREKANLLDHFADKFLHEAQELEKAQ